MSSADDDPRDLQALFDETAPRADQAQTERWARHAATLPDRRVRRRWWLWPALAVPALAGAAFVVWRSTPGSETGTHNDRTAAISAVPGEELGGLDLLIAAADDADALDQPEIEEHAEAKSRPREDRTQGKKRKQRLARVKQEILIKRVGLSGNEADAVLKHFLEHEKERRALRRQLRKANRELKRVVADHRSDDTAYTAALEGVDQARAALQTQQARQLERLEELLPPRKRARLLTTLHRLRKRLRKR